MIKSKLTIPSLIFINTLIVFFVWEYPFVMKIKGQANLYRTIVTDQMPTIRIDENGFEMFGSLPYTAKLNNHKTVRLDTVVDTSLLTSYNSGSVWITEDTLYYRARERIIRISTGSITLDTPRTYTGAELKMKIEKSFNGIFTGILLLMAGLTLIGLLLTALVAAGSGAIVDAFSEGPFSYRQILRIASALQLVWILVSMAFYYFNVARIHLLLPLTILYLLSMMGVVYFLINYRTEEI